MNYENVWLHLNDFVALVQVLTSMYSINVSLTNSLRVSSLSASLNNTSWLSGSNNATNGLQSSLKVHKSYNNNSQTTTAISAAVIGASTAQTVTNKLTMSTTTEAAAISVRP
uniref:Uncharacterized protein n=1 Tax=Lygus hesperus TaxID=30085 RepID=A0A0A9WAI1_LYGHE